MQGGKGSFLSGTPEDKEGMDSGDTYCFSVDFLFDLQGARHTYDRIYNWSDSFMDVWKKP